MAQTKMWFGMVTLPSKGPMRDQYVFLMANVFIGFLFSISISGDFASYVIEMIMLLNLECTLAQTRMVFGRVIYLVRGP